MSTASAARLLTWDEFLELDEHDLKHAELIDGELVVNPPTPLHQRIVGKVHFAFLLWAQGRESGGEVRMESFVKITDRRGYQPDLAWWPQDRVAPAHLPPEVTGPPALVVEILSPSTRMVDLLRTPRDYARIGVRELWVIDPDGPTVAVLTCTGDPVHLEPADEPLTDGDLTSPLLPGFAVAVRSLIVR